MKKTDAFELCCKKNKQVYKWPEGFTQANYHEIFKQQLGFRKKEDRNNIEKETYSINNVTTDRVWKWLLMGIVFQHQVNLLEQQDTSGTILDLGKIIKKRVYKTNNLI